MRDTKETRPTLERFTPDDPELGPGMDLEDRDQIADLTGDNALPTN